MATAGSSHPQGQRPGRERRVLHAHPRLRPGRPGRAVHRDPRQSRFSTAAGPYGTAGSEHYAFAVSGDEFDAIFGRLKAAGIAYGPSFNAVGTNTGPGAESGVRDSAPTLYFFDPNRHLLEIRSYER
jgi:catechol 2,3-dioxygenase-like lactoylglutathione lyase family enzyme